MSEQDRYIPGVPCWVDCSQADPRAAVAFYGGLFGWEAENVMPPGSGGEYYVATIRQEPVAGIGSQPEGTPPNPAWDTYIRVESADQTADKARAAGGRVLSEPFDVGPFGRTAVIADPGGATFSIWQAGEHGGAMVVNEHGAVNFNNLHTTDPERAEAFYGAVFGWELLRVGETMLAWALAAYGDFLEGIRPGMRDQMKAMNAPERFEEVVASVIPSSGDEPDHWSVTFGVDDADAIAAKAAELGGEVLVPPTDAPWVRTTVIRDPQGATFTANQFKPENRDLPSPAGAAAGS